jgi:hypothetical protein
LGGRRARTSIRDWIGLLKPQRERERAKLIKAKVIENTKIENTKED